MHRIGLRLLALALSLLGASFASPAQGGEKAYLWFRMWPDLMVKYDVETDEVVAKVQSRHGVAHRSQLTHDRSRFLLVTGQQSKVEVLDVAKAEVVDVHNFEEPDYIVRIDDLREIPGGTHWYVKIEKIKREPDHFVVEKPEWLLYDHTEWKVEKRMKELPEAIRRSARISPDGTKWHVMGRDLVVVDPESLEEEGKIELSKPLYSGLGSISVRGEDFYDWENPSAYKFYYTMRDPVKRNRSLAGVVELDLEAMEVSQRTEWGAAPRVRGFRLTRDKALGISTRSTGERRDQANGDDPVATLVTYDMRSGKKLRETRVELRNGLRLSAISPDGQKLYFSGRGHELVLFDGQHRPLRTVELGGETDGRFTLLYE